MAFSINPLLGKTLKVDKRGPPKKNPGRKTRAGRRSPEGTRKEPGRNTKGPGRSPARARKRARNRAQKKARRGPAKIPEGSRKVFWSTWAPMDHQASRGIPKRGARRRAPERARNWTTQKIPEGKLEPEHESRKEPGRNPEGPPFVHPQGRE